MEIFLISVTNLFTKTKQSKNSKENSRSRCDPPRKPFDDALYGRFADMVAAIEVLIDTLLRNTAAAQRQVFLIHRYIPDVIDRQATL